GILSARGADRRGTLAPAARACLDARARPRPRARGGAAGGLSGLGLDHGRAAEDADAGRARAPRAAFGERAWPARRRARVQPLAPARPSDRARTGDGDRMTQDRRPRTDDVCHTLPSVLRRLSSDI